MAAAIPAGAEPPPSLPGALVAWAGETTAEEDAAICEAAAASAAALRADPQAWAAVEASAEDALEAVEARLREEDRTLEQLLGPAATSSLEKSISVGLGEGFGQEDIRAALQTPAVERAVGAVLKDGIFEFLQTVDLLGNAVNRLPILGPLRQQVVEGLRREVDRVLGAQINGFLGRYTRLAAERTLLPFLTADSNRAVLAKSAGQFARYALGRQVKDVLPPPETAAELRREALEGIRGLDAAATAREATAAARRLMRRRPEPAASPAVVSAMGPLNDALESQLQRFLPVDRRPPSSSSSSSSDALAAELLESPALVGLADDRKRRLRDRLSALLEEELGEASGAAA